LHLLAATLQTKEIGMSAWPRILIGCALITIVVLLAERNRTLAGIFATAPINIPIILWILWGQTEGNHANLQVVTSSMLTGIVSTAAFIAICWFGFGRRWSLPQIFAAGYIMWAILVFGPALVRRLFDRGG
jgi:hypothetical protein